LVTSALRWLAVFAKDGTWWRQNSGRTQTATGRLVQLAPAGTADVIGILGPGGRFCGLEAKRPGNKPTPIQREWAERVRALGGFAAVFTSLDELAAAVERARGGESE
jgi:hypothetical protein